jgi:hypothetical protein
MRFSALSITHWAARCAVFSQFSTRDDQTVELSRHRATCAT